MEVETTETKTADNSAKKKLLLFWLRMLGWIGAGVVAPITTFSIKFGLFDETGYNITTDELGNVTGMNIAMNGWGILSVFLIAFAVLEVLKEVLEAQGSGYTYSKQLLNGVKSRIVPLAIMLGIAFWLDGVIQQLQFCLIVLLISQTTAIMLNPLPKWKSEKLKKEDYSDAITTVIDVFKRKMSKGDK